MPSARAGPSGTGSADYIPLEERGSDDEDDSAPFGCPPIDSEDAILRAAVLEIHPDTLVYLRSPALLARSFGPPSPTSVLSNHTLILAALAACMGSLVFGFDQGILAISLTMRQFLEQYPEMDSKANAAGELNKG